MTGKNTIEAKRVNAKKPTPAAKSAALHTPPLKLDTALLNREGKKLAAALDDVRPEYGLARLAFYATASPEDDGMGLDVRALAQATTRARVLRAHPGISGEGLREAMASGSVFFVGKSRIAEYASAFRLLVTGGLVSAEAFGWAMKVRNRKVEVAALVAQVGSVPLGDARTDAFVVLCREALVGSHAAARVARDAAAAAKAAEAVAAERKAAKAAKSSTPAVSEGEGSVPMSADVAVAVLAEIGATLWSTSDRSRIIAAMTVTADALTAPALV